VFSGIYPFPQGGWIVTKRNWVLAFSMFVALATFGVLAQQRAGGQAPARGNPPPPRAPLTSSAFLSHDKVAGCATGGTFINTPEYMIQCSHRNGPGVVEIHKKETDIIYVIDGTATFVTGGTATGLSATEGDQPRGKDITGGQVHNLVKGDIIAVPAGQPHWFKEVPKEVSYYVVKVLKP
jgi:mannose-6-phosphate isomerase-like protein (cupin superfamily)